MAGKRKGGPIPRIDAEKVKSIVRDLGAGVPRKYAAERVGITERCLYKWLANGRKGGKKNAELVQLVHDVKKAEADAVAGSLARIRKAGAGGSVVERTTITTNAKGITTTKVVEKLLPPQWTADAWYLERRHPGEFALNRKKDIEEAVAKVIDKAIRDGTLTLPNPEPGKADA
jgi:transposase